MHISRTIVVPPYRFELVLQTKNGDAHSVFSVEENKRILEKIMSQASMELHKQVEAIGGDHGTVGGASPKV